MTKEEMSFITKCATSRRFEESEFVSNFVNTQNSITRVMNYTLKKMKEQTDREFKRQRVRMEKGSIYREGNRMGYLSAREVIFKDKSKA